MEAPPLQLGLKASWSILLTCLPLPYVKTALLPLQDAAAKSCPAAGEQPSPDNWTSLVMALIFFTSKILKTRWPSPWRLLGQYRYTTTTGNQVVRCQSFLLVTRKRTPLSDILAPKGMVSSASCLSSIFSFQSIQSPIIFPPTFHPFSLYAFALWPALTPTDSPFSSSPFSPHRASELPSVTKRSKRNHGIYSASRKPDVLKLDQKW